MTAWTTGGNIPDAIVRLQASPASVTPEFSFGCGSNDGTTACDLGAMDAKSAQRQLQAQITVAATSTASSVKLTVIGSAAHLKNDPSATATVAITGPDIPAATTSPLPIGSLPAIPTPSPTLTPGGNAAGLFPTINPSPSTSTSVGKKTVTRSVANTGALPEGASVIGAQLVGLGALAVAFVLAITRLTLRRRPSPAAGAVAGGAPSGGIPAADGPSPSGAAQPPASDAQPATPDAQPGTSQADKDAPSGSEGASDGSDPAPEA